jgi:hypothetical protein
MIFFIHGDTVMDQNQQISVPVKDIALILEPLIRRVIRQELARIVDKHPDVFILDPEMPIYHDMKKLKNKKLQNKIELFSDKEVWNE